MSQSERADFFVGESGKVSFTAPIRLSKLCKLLGVGQSVMIREVIRYNNFFTESLKDEKGRILPMYANVIGSYVEIARQEGRIPSRKQVLEEVQVSG